MKLHSVTKRYATHPSPFRCISIHHTFSRLVNVSLQYPFKNYFGKRLNSKFIFPPTLHIVKPDQIVNLFERLYLMEKMDTCFSSFRFSCEIAHLWKGWISWESWTRVFYCEARPNYSFLEKAGQFKKLDAHFRTVQLFELSSFFKKWIIWSGFAIPTEMNFLLRSQIKLLTCEKAGSYEKAGHVFFIVQLFLDSKFL